VGWAILNLVREPSGSFRLYIVFLIVACVAAGLKAINVWRPAPPFMLSRQAKNPEYLRLLRISNRSLSNWMKSAALGWALSGSIVVSEVCGGLLEGKATGRMVIQLLIHDLAMALSLALFVVSVVFLFRWHVSNRIELLRD
jgi:hypothetical protein